MITISIEEPSQKERTVRFEKTVLSIGRAPANDLNLAHSAGVSRYHATLLYQDGVLTICDLQSTNGTYVDGEAVSSTEVSTASRICIGDATLTIKAAADERSFARRAATRTALSPPAAEEQRQLLAHPRERSSSESAASPTLASLIAHGWMSAPMAEYLEACMRLGKNILIVGARGSGKSTLVEALSSDAESAIPVVAIVEGTRSEHVLALLQSRCPPPITAFFDVVIEMAPPAPGGPVVRRLLETALSATEKQYTLVELFRLQTEPGYNRRHEQVASSLAFHEALRASGLDNAPQIFRSSGRPRAEDR